jgi:hypothetical protein
LRRVRNPEDTIPAEGPGGVTKAPPGSRGSRTGLPASGTRARLPPGAA